jgi:hypothetical protein
MHQMLPRSLRDDRLRGVMSRMVAPAERRNTPSRYRVVDGGPASTIALAAMLTIVNAANVLPATNPNRRSATAA